MIRKTKKRTKQAPGTFRKQISNKEYEDWRQYQYDKINGRILQPDTIRFICESYDFDAEKIGQHFLELLPKLCPPDKSYWMK